MEENIPDKLKFININNNISPGTAATHCIIPYKIDVNIYGNRTSKELNSCIMENVLFWKILMHICKNPKFNPVMNSADANIKNKFCIEGKGRDKSPTMPSVCILSVNCGDISVKIWNNNTIIIK